MNYSPNVYVLNNSWGLAPAGRYSTTVRMAFAHAYKMNRTAVVSMGNNDGSQTQYPAGFGQGIIAVGATDQGDAVASFSDIGNHIDVSAPGVSILSTYRNGDNFYNQQGVLDPNYYYNSGTSMAAPHVSGIASILKGYNANLYNDDIEHIIQLSAYKVAGMNGQDWTDQYGYGRVNAKKALDFFWSPNVLRQLTGTGISVFGAGSSPYRMTIYGAQGLSDGVYTVSRHEVLLDVSFPTTMEPKVWGRGVATQGWSAENPNFSMGWCDVVPGTVTSTSARLRTYIYEIILSQWVFFWYPTDPGNVTFAYTVLGTSSHPLSVGISGPSSLKNKQLGTWTANVTGGSGSVSYQWYYSDDGGITWNPLGTAQSQSRTMATYDFKMRCYVHENGEGQNARAALNVLYDAPPLAPQLSWVSVNDANGVPHPKLIWNRRDNDIKNFKLYSYPCAYGVGDCNEVPTLLTTTTDTTYIDLSVTVWVKTQAQPLPPSTVYYYVTATDYSDQVSPISNKATVNASKFTVADQGINTDNKETLLPTETKLEANFPNPFNPTTIISYQLTEAAHVTIRLYDMLGREIKTLVDELKPPGYHQVSVDASQLASGIYIYRMIAGNYAAVRKLVVMK